MADTVSQTVLFPDLFDKPVLSEYRAAANLESPHVRL